MAVFLLQAFSVSMQLIERLVRFRLGRLDFPYAQLEVRLLTEQPVDLQCRYDADCDQGRFTEPRRQYDLDDNDQDHKRDYEDEILPEYLPRPLQTLTAKEEISAEWV